MSWMGTHLHGCQARVSWGSIFNSAGPSTSICPSLGAIWTPLTPSPFFFAYSFMVPSIEELFLFLVLSESQTSAGRGGPREFRCVLVSLPMNGLELDLE